MRAPTKNDSLCTTSRIKYSDDPYTAKLFPPASARSVILATTLVVAGWFYFISATAMDAIWPMFGIANQMLAVIALAIATVALIHNNKRRYLWITLLPMTFVITTTGSAAYILLRYYITQIQKAPTINPIIASTLILAITLCTAIILIASLLATRRAGISDVDSHPAR